MSSGNGTEHPRGTPEVIGKSPRRGTWRVLASVASALLISGYWYSRMWEVDVAREHGPMENFQIICLLLAAVGFWRESRVRPQPGEKHFYRLGALGCLTMFLLEFDVRPFEVHLLTTLLNGIARNVWLGLLWFWCLKPAWFYRHQVMNYLQGWRLTPACFILAAAGSFWMAGAAFEKLHLFARPANLFMEEAMESNGAWLMLWAAGETASAWITTCFRTAKGRST